MNLIEFKAKLKKTKKLIIIGPVSPQIPKKLLTLHKLFVDGGTRYFKVKKGVCFSLGDGDTFTGDTSTKNQLDLLLPAKKDYSDFKFALSLVPNNLKEIYLTGFLGKRKDHELINFGEVHQFLRKRKSTVVHFLAKNQLKITAISSGKHSFSHTGNFSILALESAEISLTGKCEYKILKKRKIAILSSQGLSNIGFGKIKLKTNRPVFIFFGD